MGKSALILAASSALFAAALLSGQTVPGNSLPNGQGWDRDQELRWYHADQGSRLIPKVWMLNLEQAGSMAKFFSPENVASFGYLPPDPDDHSGLPIGFSENDADDANLTYTKLRWMSGQGRKEPWIGMTCAACHTGRVRDAAGDTLTIDGAPGDGDFQSLIEQLDLAMAATLNQPDKFDRFAKAVLGPRVASDRGMLRAALSRLVAWEKSVQSMNDPAIVGRTTVRYGPARLDAFAHIFNKMALLDGADQQFAAPADAPVSYPFLWNVHQHDKVQWDGIAPNHGLKMPSGQVFDVGAIGRNTGEMIGVFGDVAVPGRYPGLSGYSSSANVHNLDAIEVQLSKLLPPAWPKAFGTIDPGQVSEGEGLYKTSCIGCHALLKSPHDLDTPIAAHMSQIWGDFNVPLEKRPVGTDAWMACNAFSYRARAGRLKGTPEGYLSGAKIADIGDDRTLLTATVGGTLSGQKAALVKTAGRAFFGLPRIIQPPPKNALVSPELAQRSPAGRLAFCQQNATDKLMAYKGRPLNGIWATAPYLHDGSVPSLYALLLPPDQRPPQFDVGGRTLDTKDVGFVAGPGDPTFTLHTRDAANHPVPGNSSVGHNYGTQLHDTQRYALIAYLKTL